MGEFKAGKWVAILFLYFVFLIAFVTVIESVANTTDTDLDDYTDYSRLTNDYVCGSPRYKYDANTGERTVLPRASEGQLNCEESKGVLDSNSCNTIAGCNWTTTSEGFWWWETSKESCIGNINASSYGITEFQPVIGRPRVLKQNSTFYEQSTRSVCKHNEVVFNATLCDYFSCKWEKYDFSQNVRNPSDVIGTIGNIFAFRYDFGLTNVTLAWISRMLFIILPLLMLIISIYFMLPVIH